MRLLDAALVVGLAALLSVSGAYFLYQASGSLLIDSLTGALFSVGMALTGLLGLLLFFWALSSAKLKFLRDVFQQLPASYFLGFLALIVVVAALGLYLGVLSQDNFMQLVLMAAGAVIGYGTKTVEIILRPKSE